MAAAIPGTQKALRQPKRVTRYPEATAMTAPPSWCDAFHMPQARPISRGLYHYVRSRVQGGTPTPWNTLLRAHTTPKKARLAPSPKKRLMAAEAIRASPSR